MWNHIIIVWCDLAKMSFSMFMLDWSALNSLSYLILSASLFLSTRRTSAVRFLLFTFLQIDDDDVGLEDVMWCFFCVHCELSRYFVTLSAHYFTLSSDRRRGRSIGSTFKCIKLCVEFLSCRDFFFVTFFYIDSLVRRLYRSLTLKIEWKIERSTTQQHTTLSGEIKKNTSDQLAGSKHNEIIHLPPCALCAYRSRDERKTSNFFVVDFFFFLLLALLCLR